MVISSKRALVSCSLIKKLLLAIAGITLVLCLLLPPSQATLTKPNVPQFTINIYDSSYDIAPTSTIDPFNGQPTGTPGQHVDSRTIEIRIKNPYPPSSGAYPTDFHYDIQYRGHFGTDNGWWPVFDTRYGYLKPVSSSEETIYKVVATLSGDYAAMSPWSRGLPVDATIDFQVSAFIGGYTGTPITGWDFNGETSGWSQTQTITLNFDEAAPKYVPSSEEMYGIVTYASPQPTPTNSVKSHPTTTNTPTNSATSPSTQPTQTADTTTQQSNELTALSVFNPLLIIAVVAVLAAVIILAVIVIKRKKNASQTH
jgi:hypothetical protein